MNPFRRFRRWFQRFFIGRVPAGIFIEEVVESVVVGAPSNQLCLSVPRSVGGPPILIRNLEELRAFNAIGKEMARLRKQNKRLIIDHAIAMTDTGGALADYMIKEQE